MKIYKVVVKMKDTEGEGKVIPFDFIAPAVDDEAARTAAFNLGYLINESTNHRLKIRETSFVEIP